MLDKSASSVTAKPTAAARPLPVDLTAAVLLKPISLKRPASWVEHIPFAYWLMDLLRPSTFVELGTHSGNSYFSFCQAAKQFELGTQCFAIDTWKGDDHAGKYGEDIYVEVQRHNERHYRSFSRLLRSTFDEALEGFSDASIDLLHIDGLHTYEGVKHDFESWLPKLKSNAIVLFHDTNVLDRGFGVFRLWRELAERYPSFEFRHSNGLGVISLSHEPPKELRSFFATSGDQPTYAVVRDLFSTLGQSFSAQLVLEHEVAVRAEEHARLATLTTNYEAAMARGNGLLEEASQAIKQRDDALAEIVQSSIRHTSLEAQIEAAETRAQASLQRATETIASLEKRYEESQRMVESLHAQNDLSLLKISAVEAQVADLREKQLLALKQKNAALAEIEQGSARHASLEMQLRDSQSHADELAQQAARAIASLEGQKQESERVIESLLAHNDVSLLKAAAAETQAADAEVRAAKILKAREAELFGEIQGLRDESANRLAEALEEARVSTQELALTKSRMNAPRWLVRRLFGASRDKILTLLHRRRVARHGQHAVVGSSPDNSFAKKKALISHSGLFDESYYLSQSPGDAAAAADPIGHYLLVGMMQGKNPNEFFDTKWCLETHSDLAAHNVDPLVHYIVNGSEEGRATSPHFDAGFYRKAHPDVAAAGLEPLRHFLENGRFEGRLATRAIQQKDGSEFFAILAEHDLGNVGVVDPPGSRKAGQWRSADQLIPPLDAEVVAVPDIKVDVIIPVYGGLDETRQCIESVLQYRPRNKTFGRLILVDDCGPEPKLRELLRQIAAREEGLELLVNPVNLGFVKSVNRAMKASTRDVVLLNADTEVHGDWLDRMARQASVPSVATVTAFSNNATICTFPQIGGAPELPFGRSLAEIDDAFRQANKGRQADLPTGVGFCMYISRASLNELGLFDEAFGKGYGEETDFCQKALQAGWRNVLAGDVFVFHHGSVSFGASAAAEQMAGGAMMRQRFPDYEPSVSRWIAKDPALPFRFAAMANLLKADARSVLLHVIHPWGGGTEKQVAELVEGLSSEAQHLILIAKRAEEGVKLSLLTPEGQSWRKFSFSVGQFSAATLLLKSFGVERIHIHHALEVMEGMSAFIASMDCPYILSVHDYSLICPRNNLIDSKGMYCGEPDEQGCLSCLRQEPTPRSRDILFWRHLGVDLIEGAERVICPTIDVAARIQRYAPDASVIVVPHEASLYNPVRLYNAVALGVGETLRIAALGVFAEHKGGVFLLECIERARIMQLPIQWNIIGYFPGALGERARALKDVLSVTGPYDSANVRDLIENVDPHLIFFPQHCVETYSYTLSEALASGRGILAPNLGAFPERISGVSGCWSYDVQDSPTDVLARIDGLRAKVFEPNDGKGVAPFVDGRNLDIAVVASYYKNGYLG